MNFLLDIDQSHIVEAGVGSSVGQFKTPNPLWDPALEVRK